MIVMMDDWLTKVYKSGIFIYDKHGKTIKYTSMGDSKHLQIFWMVTCHKHIIFSGDDRHMLLVVQCLALVNAQRWILIRAQGFNQQNGEISPAADHTGLGRSIVVNHLILDIFGFPMPISVYWTYSPIFLKNWSRAGIWTSLFSYISPLELWPCWMVGGSMRGTRAGASTSLEKRQPPCSGTGVLRTCLPCAWAAFQRRGWNSWDILGPLGQCGDWAAGGHCTALNQFGLHLAPGCAGTLSKAQRAGGTVERHGETLDQLISLVSFAL
jgi:hypothetical protein